MKKCPFCAEEIQDEAIKCKHCNEFLAEKTASPSKAPWYYSMTSLVVGFFCVGPLVLPLVWLNPRLTQTWKIGITLLILGISWWLWQAMAQAMVSLDKYFDLMKGAY